MQKKHVWINSKIIFGIVAGLLWMLPGYADNMMKDDVHESMMGDDYGRYAQGMMGGGMGMMNMMGGGSGMMNMMGGGMGMMSGGISPMMMNMLDLDGDQKDKIREMMREQRNNRCKAMNSMMDVRDELAKQYDKEKPDASAIGKTYQKMFDQKRQMIEQAIVLRNKIRGVLNKEQQKMFDQMQRTGGMMGRGGMNMMGSGMGQGGMGMMQ